MPFSKLLLLSASLIFCMAIHAQSKITLSGFVYESNSKESLPGAVIATADMSAGTTSNAFGFYTITLPAQANLTLVVQLVGYQRQEVKFNGLTNEKVDIYLKNEASFNEVVIEAERQERISEDSRMSTIGIPIDQIKKIPALLGEKDVLKVIQLMPGVQKGSEGSAGFYVRGGGPDQNLIILDDATVYNANHLFGFFSIFNGDALKSVELIKGGFPARYGGRLSSVLELRMKDGNKEEVHGEVGIGLVSSRFTLEGPVVKGKSSFLVSGRRTYIDALIYPFLPSDAKGGYFFYDFNAKYNHIIDDKNRLYVSGYFGKDKFYFRPTDSQGGRDRGSFLWGNATATARWNRIINDKTFANASVIFTNYDFGINFRSEEADGDFSELDYSSGIRDWTAKYDVDFQPNPKHYIRLGASATYHTFTPSATVIQSSFGLGNSNEDEKLYSFEGGLYIEDDWSIRERLKVNIGVRLSQYNQENRWYVRPEPRVSGRFMLNELTSVKASYALMNQYVHLLSNTGIGLPTDLWVPATNRIEPQQSQQVAFGFARDIPKHKLMVSLEGYYKVMNNIIAYKEGASFLEVGIAEEANSVSWQDQVTAGTGSSYGLELLVQRKVGKLTGWIGYTLSWTTLQFDELNNGESFFARYDRRHDASIVGIYEVNDKLTLSATWVYGTGQAITLPLASYTVSPHDPTSNNLGGGGGGIGGGFPVFAEDYGGRNQFRMAAYHRLDIAAQWKKQMKRCERTFELGVYNAYNRWNPFYYYSETDFNGTTSLKQISLFPIIPSVSWSYKF